MPVVCTLFLCRSWPKELYTTQEWVAIESTELPHFDMENVMFNCFIERHVSDGAKANDYKKFNVKLSHMHILYINQAMHISIYVSHKGNEYFIKSMCLPEMKKRYSLQIRDDF